MLSKKYYRDFSKGATVGEIIETLKAYPQDAKFTVLGDPWFYIHGESDGSTVIVDDAELIDVYEDWYDDVEPCKAQEVTLHDVEGHSKYLQNISLPMYVNTVQNGNELSPSKICEMHIGKVNGEDAILITPEEISLEDVESCDTYNKLKPFVAEPGEEIIPLSELIPDNRENIEKVIDNIANNYMPDNVDKDFGFNNNGDVIILD